MNKRKVPSLEEFEDGASYVASGTRTFAPLAYGQARNRILQRSDEDPGRLIQPKKLAKGGSVSLPGSGGRDDGRVIDVVSSLDPEHTSRVLLNLKTTQTFEEVLRDLGGALNMNGVKKMTTKKGEVSVESNQPLDLASTIRQIVREELSLYAQVAHSSAHHSHLPPEFEPNVASFSSYQAAKDIEEYDLMPQQQPRLYNRGPIPMTLDHNENSRVFILETLCLTTSRCDKDSTDLITMMRLTTDTADSSERQRPVTRMITNLLAVSSGLGFVATTIV
ncbi:hypothetical protein HPB52_024992 [Rhipicephalus sanguineus]|uniref:Doublecortin domain-containing protein n=1 Tax=Rhipicephalus sanguineus TaxID=34632 RepID=A0A9D4TDL0_RHISA|nr:hypothetical protein HPB52_024992 [Rhipicephalus sanguineus]